MSSEQKPWWKKALWILLIAGGIGILSQLAISSYSLWRKRDIVIEREAYLQTLEKNQDQLKTELSQSLTGGFIEREARNKLGLAKTRETVIIMPEATSGAAQTTASNQTQNEPNIPNWKKWWKLFF